MRGLDGVIPFVDRNVFSSLKRQILLFDRFYVGAIDEAGLEPHELTDCEFLQERNILIDVADVIDGQQLPASINESTKAQGVFALILAAISYGGPTVQKVLAPDKPEWDGWKKLQDGTQGFLLDLLARIWAIQLTHQSDSVDVAAVCQSRLPAEFGQSSGLKALPESLLHVVLECLPLPDEGQSWHELLDFKAELRDKQWAFRRWLCSMATKRLNEAEIRDELEWMLNEYSKAMKVHKIRASQSFLDIFVISPMEIIEHVAKLNWSKIARGLLQAQKRNLELMEAEMKAPGRECAYVFHARNKFGA